MDKEEKNSLNKGTNEKNNLSNKAEKTKEDIIKHLHDMKDIDIFGAKSKYIERMENDLEEQKYIKEMQDMEDKLSRKNNYIVVGVVGLGLAIVVGLGIKIMQAPIKNFSFNDKAKVEKKSKEAQEKKEEEAVKGNKSKNNNSENLPEQNNKTYTYAVGNDNRKKSIEESIKINENNKSGITAIFIAELLRKAEVSVPKKVTNTKALVEDLTNKGWKKYTDPKQLKKGDVCFTTDMSNMEGYPSHVYIFMGWVKEGNTDEGYVCDSLVEENKDSLHKRTIGIETETKQKMAFFMRK
ncbi:hypothetical protein HAHI6034_10830 [Hathewaya histolytica]|uniref:2,3-dihydro-2,3-dihydroxybenzoate dehydrogenase n=1 Tax=Hathewaya histolytica TaxID=1498 RepID=A0A4U9RF71_HATHI|nr:hypothetical protein [Hathewaya histolytica]VTQ89043.1 2,3-dihydro-2,3-dihydroxybenzoate dehydrogenase [Hathewaya histolytica]